jgi:hypothetical protein
MENKMSKQIEKINVVDSGIKVVRETTSIPRKMTPQAIAADMYSRITGKLLGWGDLFDPKTNQFLSESDLVAKGAVFVTISYRSSVKMNKKNRTTKEKNPFADIVKTSKYQVIANIDWESYINRRGHGDFKAQETRANGIENYENCRAIGITKQGNHTINGVAFRVLEETKYWDTNGNEIEHYIMVDYLPPKNKESAKKEAEKHGIDVKFDPKYRTTRIDSCASVRGFGFEYIPI